MRLGYAERISSWRSAASRASGIVGVSSRQCGRSLSWTIAPEEEEQDADHEDATRR